MRSALESGGGRRDPDGSGGNHARSVYSYSGQCAKERKERGWQAKSNGKMVLINSMGSSQGL